MRRGLLYLLRILPVICILAAEPVMASDASHPLTIEVPVVIQGGGTAVISPEADAPQPKERTLTLSNGKKGCFLLRFREPGDYHYHVVQKTGENASVNYDSVRYLVTIHVMATQDQMNGICVIESKTGKTNCIRFVNTEKNQVLGRKRPPGLIGGPSRIPGVQTGDPGCGFLAVLPAAAGALFVLLRKLAGKKAGKRQEG